MRAAEPGDSPRTGQVFDAAPFGFSLREEEGRAIGVRWTEPRRVRQVVVAFDPAAALSETEGVRVQYWHATWDGRPDPVLAEKNAGSVGWHAMDDWTNGRWQDAAARVIADGHRWTFTFDPSGTGEFPKLTGNGVRYRKTLKLRLLREEPWPAGVRLQALSDSVYQPLTVRIHWGQPAQAAFAASGPEYGHIEAFNGAVTAVRSADGDILVQDDKGWELPLGGEGVLEVDMLAAVGPEGSLSDRTIITVRSDARPFSFPADEIRRGERLFVPDLGVLAVRGDDPVTLEQYQQARTEFAGRTIYERVADEPEQTLARAWNDMPLKRPLYFVHGLPGNRNAMHQEPNGDVVITSHGHWFARQRSPRDSDRKDWQGDRLTLRFGFPPDHLRGGRALKDGYLPLLRTWWQDGPLYYEQTTILGKLEPDFSRIVQDDPTALFMRVRVVNTSEDADATAGLHLTAEGESLTTEGDGVVAEKGRLRYLLDARNRGELFPEGEGVRWRVKLPPGGSCVLDFKVPSITLTEEAEIASLRRQDFGAVSGSVCTYWKQRTAAGTQIDTPEPWLNDFHKAHLRHLLVNCIHEKGSDRLHAHVGTFVYGVYPDESAMMISDLDRRGYHDEARRCLESFLHYQGTKQMPGNFRTTEGLFYGSGGHDMGGYNKSHGWVMWNMAEHWRFTRDREWMQRAAPKLVAACYWVTRERQATMHRRDAGATPTLKNGGRPLEYGFLPAGSLEDVTDYWYWLVTNVCTVWGFEHLADALSDFGHPEAERLQKDARAFRDDVMAAIEESRIRAPVVRLRDGTYVPKYPSRLYERGRAHGWLRETLEGSIHLLITGMLPPDAPQARWIIDDFEDNLYISDDYGYSIPAFDAFWFSRGGFSMQANLLGGPLVYLYRDDIKHFLRAYFNSFASAYYPEIAMCNEHSLPELGYPAGDHLKSSDEAQSTYWLRLMFVHERGEDLYLGQAVPRDWLSHGRRVGIERAASHFGPLSLRISSEVDEGRIRAEVTPPRRNLPQKTYLRLRHPESRRIRRVSINGHEYDQFDADREWILLPQSPDGILVVVAHYQ